MWTRVTSLLPPVEIEAGVIDPVMIHVGEHPQEGRRHLVELREGEFALVELIILEGVRKDLADHRLHLGRRRFVQRPGSRLDRIGEEEYAQLLGVRPGAWITIVALTDLGFLLTTAFLGLVEEVADQLGAVMSRNGLADR